MLISPIFGAYVFALRVVLTDQFHIYKSAILPHAARDLLVFLISIIQSALRRVCNGTH